MPAVCQRFIKRPQGRTRMVWSYTSSRTADWSPLVPEALPRGFKSFAARPRYGNSQKDFYLSPSGRRYDNLRDAWNSVSVNRFGYRFSDGHIKGARGAVLLVSSLKLVKNFHTPPPGAPPPSPWPSPPLVVVDSRTGKKISIPHLQEHLMWSCYVVVQALQHNAFSKPDLAHNNVITIDTTIDTHPP